MSILSERLRGLRKLHKLTQKDVADFLNITESGYGYYEQGRREPSVETLRRIAYKYGVTVSYLTGQEDNTPDNYSSLHKIAKLVKEYGLGKLKLFDINEWKSLSPNDIRMIEEHFQVVVKYARKRTSMKD